MTSALPYIASDTNNCLNEKYRNVFINLVLRNETLDRILRHDNQMFHVRLLPRIYITVTVPLFREQQDFPLNDAPFLDLTS